MNAAHDEDAGPTRHGRVLVDATVDGLDAGLRVDFEPLQLRQVDDPDIRQNLRLVVFAADDDQAGFVGDQAHTVVLPATGLLA